jgi:hypothetical protein
LEEAESSARVIRRDGRRAWSGFHLRAGVVRVEDVLNAPGSICPDLDHRLLVDCDEVGCARRNHNDFTGPDRFDLRGIVDSTKTDKECP